MSLYKVRYLDWILLSIGKVLVIKFPYGVFNLGVLCGVVGVFSVVSFLWSRAVLSIIRSHIIGIAGLALAVSYDMLIYLVFKVLLEIYILIID